MRVNHLTERVSSWKKHSTFIVGRKHQTAIYNQSDSPLRYKEGQTGEIRWKWIHLPMKSQNRTINKLVVSNEGTEETTVRLNIRYEMIARGAEVVYYSPSQESLIVHDRNCYALFGGMTSQETMCKYSTTLLDEAGRHETEHAAMQPIVQFSHGWGLEYHMVLQPDESGYFYEWEMKHEDLLWLEDAHAQYLGLLSSGAGTARSIVNE
ncbi:hypothetical protein CR205_08645 [Alteribacter lacisalsi]|uniref:Uncharacterized protein n=1 Tax=Alteribacter lacisalsi TaxID=2045244 RepID=A0A2W0H9V6_9BACI|nr:hypothetical protein [Alteribacter lacisalsi]PYZ98633.1 hypothetical protein CR205_08645 [Alteribacter lacisalsi]